MAELTDIPESVMVVVAHPDDAEFMCAGTIARWTANGCKATYVVITKGDKGSEDPEMTPDLLAKIREAEQRAAGEILGVSAFEFLGFEDAYLEPTLEVRKEITRLIRKYRPEVVITFDPTTRFFRNEYVNHPDHRAAGEATVDAVFPSARDRLTFPDLLAQGLEPHKVRELLLGLTDQINVVVDIGDTLEQKKRALLAHPSQLGPDIADYAVGMSEGAAESEDFEFGEGYRQITIDRPEEDRPLPGEDGVRERFGR